MQKYIVSKVKDTKFESNSQLFALCMVVEAIVSKVKDTKFESNSQQHTSVTKSVTNCF